MAMGLQGIEHGSLFIIKRDDQVLMFFKTVHNKLTLGEEEIIFLALLRMFLS